MERFVPLFRCLYPNAVSSNLREQLIFNQPTVKVGFFISWRNKRLEATLFMILPSACLVSPQ